MKKSTNGHGTLSLGGDITELRLMGATAHAVQEGNTHMVRIVIAGRLPGRTELEINLSAEDAANFASKIYSLARTAIIMNEREEEANCATSGLQAVAA